MSEQKQGSLTSIGTNKKEKKAKEVLKTVRFTIALGESTEEACPEFNYRDLLRTAEKKKNKVKPDAQLNGTSPFADDDEEELKQVAKQFEEKYGGGRKKHGRFVDYVDLGAGYDETDPFIDNTDAYDEVVPEEMTTAHGGFYINCGALEFKEVSDQSDVEESKDFKPRKRVKKVAVLPEDEANTDAEDVNHIKPANSIPALKKRRIEDGKTDLLKKQKFVSHEREIIKKKRRRAIGDLTKKRSVTVKELLREKREILDIESSPGKGAETELNATKIVPEVKKSEPKNPVPEISKTTSEPKKILPAPVAKPPSNTITDVIESVISAARGDEELSKDSSSSASKSASASQMSSDSDDSQDAEAESGPVETEVFESEKQEPLEKTEEKLPENLPEDIKDLIAALKAAALNADGKCKFFTAEVNQMVLSLDCKCQPLPCNHRHQVYSHLASFLPCTKDTLMKRAKKLRLEAEEEKIKLPLRRLKNSIESIMPSVLESYSKECQKVAEESPQMYMELYRYYWGLDASPAKSSCSEDEDFESKSSKIPKRKFPWSEELRANLVEVVYIKLQCVDLQKPRKERIDKILRNFLEENIVTLWPPGWMSVTVLLRECKEIYSSPLMKKRKLAGGLKKIALSSGTNQVSNTGSIQSSNGPTNVNSAAKSVRNLGQTSATQNVISSAKPQAQAKTKSEAASTFQPSTLGNTSRTKSTFPLSNTASNQVHSNPSSVSPVASNSTSSNVRSAPQHSSSNKAGVSNVLSPSPVKTKSGSDAFGRQNIPGKSGNPYLPERQSPSLSISSGVQCKTKSGVDIVSSKGLDVTLSGGSKVSVPSVTCSTSKINSEISIIPVSANTPAISSQKSPVSTLSLANLPDCISVTPAVSSSLQITNSTASQKSVINLKHRILQEPSKERTRSPSNFSSLPLAANMEDEGIEVIEILNDGSGPYENQKNDGFRQHNSSQAKMKSELRKRKRFISKDTLPPASLEPINSVDETKLHPTRSPSKEGDRQCNEEANNATDILNQMINESLTGYSNLVSKEVYPGDIKSVAGTASVERASPLQPVRKEPEQSFHEKGDLEKDIKRTADEDKLLIDSNLNSESKQSAADIEIKKEISRVMKSIAELQTMSGDDTAQTLEKYSPSRNSAVTLHPVSNSKSLQVKTSVSSQELSNPSAQAPRKSASISSFQEEFHRHLFRENTLMEIENLNFKAGKGAITISPIPQQSSTGVKHGTMPVEGSQSRTASRSRSTVNSGNHYSKITSGSSQSCNESSFSGRQGTTNVSSYHDGKAISSQAAGANQHSPSYQ